MPYSRGGDGLRRRGTLVILSGLPATGKTTLSNVLARALSATHLRIDTIEAALAGAGTDAGALCSVVTYALALDNLKVGNTVIADSVNAIAMTREVWRNVAARAGATALEIEISCSDPAEHRRRAEVWLVGDRSAPTYADILARIYELWRHSVHRLDTAGRAVADCGEDLIALVAVARSEMAPPAEPAGPF